MFRRLLPLIAASSMSLIAFPSFASEYPTKPIRLVVPWTAGSATDAVSRFVGDQLGRRLGTTVIIDNRPGASGILGTDFVAKSAPDGYTLLVAVTSHLTNPFFFKTISYNTDADFTPVSLLASTPAILFVRSESPIKSLDDLVKEAKSKPASLSYASSGTGNTPHLSAELFKQTAAVEITHVPYKGAAAAVPDLLGGHIPLAISLLGTYSGPYKDGKVRGLAVAAKERMASAPNIPTFAELGYPNVVGNEWFGVLAPSKTPQPIVEKLSREIDAILAQPESKARLSQLGFQLGGGSPKQFQQFMDDAKKGWATVIKAGNIQMP